MKLTPTKSMQCCHKITQFQAHRSCNQFASICEKECQQIHNSDKDQIMLITLQTVQQQYQRTVSMIKTELSNYTDYLKNIYREILAEIHKVQSNVLKEMEKQLYAELIKGLAVDRTLLQKLENKRYERIKCFQLISLIEDLKPQQKIKKGALNDIFQKYKNQTNIFRDSLFAGKPIPHEFRSNFNAKADKIEPQQVQKSSQTQKQQVKPVLNNAQMSSAVSNNNNKYLWLLQQKKKDFKQLQVNYQQLKYQNKVLMTQKSNLERELSKVTLFKLNNKGKKLRLKTWDIAQVITKKIKKARKQNAVLATNEKPQCRVIDVQEKEVQMNENIIIQQERDQPPKTTQNTKNMTLINADPQIGQQNIQQSGQNQSNNQKRNLMLNEQLQEQDEEDFFEYLRRRKVV